ncbi:MAG: ABC transporter ATP-binding protein [Anaerolineales bacterium]
MIQVRGLTKAFGPKKVLRGIDLDVAPGEFLTLVGPNGAGKTTFLRILATLSRATGGDALIGGVSIADHPAQVRRAIGLVSHRTLLYDDLTAVENLQFYGRMYDVPKLDARIDEVLRQVDLYFRRHDPVRTYSRGMQQRLSIARAILHDPQVMLMDEPYTGLDVQATAMLRTVLQGLAASGRTVIMTTHDLELGLEVADRVAILSGGKIGFQAPAKGLSIHDFRRIYAEQVAG